MKHPYLIQLTAKMPSSCWPPGTYGAKSTSHICTACSCPCAETWHKKKRGDGDFGGLLRWRVFFGKGKVWFHFWVGVFCVFFLFRFFLPGGMVVCDDSWRCFADEKIDSTPTSCWILQECSGSATNCMSCYGIAELLPKDGGGAMGRSVRFGRWYCWWKKSCTSW